jgi:hypothetical protein
VAKKFLVAMGESEGEKSIGGYVGSFFLSGPFFEVGIAATLGAFAASTIAEQLGANKLVVDVSDVAGGALGGAAMGAIIGGKFLQLPHVPLLCSNTAVIYLVLQALWERSQVQQ